MAFSQESTVAVQHLLTSALRPEFHQLIPAIEEDCVIYNALRVELSVLLNAATVTYEGPDELFDISNDVALRFAVHLGGSRILFFW